MIEGQLIGIHVKGEHGAEPQPLREVEAVAGGGLVGDRFHSNPETKPDREVTLIEIEALEALERELNISLSPAQSRRNLITRGVALNHLVDREFSVGQVRLRGMRLCEPCAYLEKLTVAGVHSGLRHRGGLRARIVAGGMLREGDVIREG